MVEEIAALEETADAEMKEDNERVKGKAEKVKAKATDMRLTQIERVGDDEEIFRRKCSGKIKKRECRSGSESMLFLSKKSGKRPGT